VLLVAVIVVVIVLFASTALYEYLTPPPPAVVVGSIVVWAPDNACGLNLNRISYSGYNSSTGAAIPFELEVPNFNTTACTVAGVVTNSSGFTVSGVQAHVAIPGYGQATLNLTITSPGSSFAGNLDLVFS